MDPFRHHLAALSLITITTLFLSCFIILRNSRRRLNQIFALYMLSIAWWSAMEHWMLLAPTAEQAFSRLRLEYAGVCFIPALFSHGVAILLGRKARVETILCYILGTGFFLGVSVLALPILIANFSSFSYLRHWPVPGPFYWSLVAYFACVTARTHQVLWRESYLGPSPIRHGQLRLLLVASLLGYAGGLPEFLLKYGVRVPVLHPYGLYLLPIHVIVITYAIVQFRLFGIRIVIRRSLVYSIVITLLTVGYFGVIYGIEHVFQTTFHYNSIWTSLAAFAVMALVFHPLRVSVQRAVDRVFFRAPQEELARRIERFEKEAKRTEKLRAVATLAAGLAHEIKNPLASIKIFAEHLPDRCNDPVFRQKFARIVAQEIDRVNGLVERLLDFARPIPPQRKPVQIGQLIDETLEFLHGEFTRRHIGVVRRYAEPDSVLVDSIQMRQVFLNIFLNSMEAMRGPSVIEIVLAAGESFLHVTVSDTGPGIPANNLSRVFDPFFTTKPSGTGLGLSVVHSIVKEHGGIVTLTSRVGVGTIVDIALPLLDSPCQGGEMPRQTLLDLTGRARGDGLDNARSSGDLKNTEEMGSHG